jgi:hypothetical protein
MPTMTLLRLARRRGAARALHTATGGLARYAAAAAAVRAGSCTLRSARHPDQERYTRLARRASGARLCSTSTGLGGSPVDGFEREVDDLGAVQLSAFVDAGAEFGAGQVVA